MFSGSVIDNTVRRVLYYRSVDAGFVLALPFDHGDLEPDCVEVSTRGGGGGGGGGGER